MGKYPYSSFDDPILQFIKLLAFSLAKYTTYFHSIVIMQRDSKRLEHNSAEVGAWERSQRSRAQHIRTTLKSNVNVVDLDDNFPFSDMLLKKLLTFGD